MSRRCIRAARAQPPVGADHRRSEGHRRAVVADRAPPVRIRGADPVASNRDIVLNARGDIVDRVQAPDVSSAVTTWPGLWRPADASAQGSRVE